MKKYENILLVDDDMVSNFINEQILKKLDIANHVFTARNGQEALEFLEQQKGNGHFPELILLDIMMPVMDGFDFLEALSRTNIRRPSKIVLLTSSSDPADLEKADRYKLAGYLNKPLTAEKLQQII